MILARQVPLMNIFNQVLERNLLHRLEASTRLIVLFVAKLLSEVFIFQKGLLLPDCFTSFLENLFQE